MGNPTNVQEVLHMVEIPGELAQELSDLLIKQGIRERLLPQLVDQSDAFDRIEDSLITIISRIEAIKMEITRNHIPEQYQSQQFIWSYNGFEIDGCNISIMQNTKN